MPVKGLVGRYRELGRLKFGEDLGDRPAQLDTWRLTSPDPVLITEAAALYGGTPALSDDGNELITETATLDIVLPPQDLVRGQWFELWSKGGLQRRCTGEDLVSVDPDGAGWTETGPCLCDPDERTCRIRTVLRVILPRLPDLGVWRLSTGSVYAALELPTSADAITLLHGGDLAVAVLGLDKRTTKKPGQPPKHYIVPILTVERTLLELMSDLQSSGQDSLRWPPTPGRDLAAVLPEVPPTEVPGNPPPSLPGDPGGAGSEKRLEQWAQLHTLLSDADPQEAGDSIDDLIAMLTTLEDLMIACRLWGGPDFPNSRKPLDVAAGRWLDGKGPVWRTAGQVPLEDLRRFASRALLDAGDRVAGSVRAAESAPTL